MSGLDKSDFILTGALIIINQNHPFTTVLIQNRKSKDSLSDSRGSGMHLFQFGQV